MSEASAGFTTTDLIAAASQILMEGGYRQVAKGFPEWDTPTSRLFEDEYSVVGIVIFDTCAELLSAWPDSQAVLVDVITSHIGSEESKSWDGYLVLLTPGLAPSETNAIEALRYNTTRLRKLVSTGDDLKFSIDVERVLRPLLPLRAASMSAEQESTLDLLPRLLAAENIPQEITRLIVEKFREQAPLLEQLHQHRGDH